VLSDLPLVYYDPNCFCFCFVPTLFGICSKINLFVNLVAIMLHGEELQKRKKSPALAINSLEQQH
jgi:hypothetical protein